MAAIGRIIGFAGAISVMACTDAPTTAPPRTAQLPEASASVGEATGRHIVLMSGNGIPSGFATQVSQLGGIVEASHAPTGLAVVSGLSDEGAAALRGQSGVASVDADIEFVVDDVAGSPESMDSIASPANPATALAFPRQWHLRAIGADKAWLAGHLGLPAVTVAILDTGIDATVPDLQGRVDATRSISFVPLNSFDEQRRVALYPGSPRFTDVQYHGTHVAATVASNALVAAGVTSRLTLIAVKVLGLTQNGNASGSSSGVLLGLLHAADNGAAVANMSLGGGFLKAGAGSLVSTIQRVFSYANQKGMTVVVAAGNEALDLDHDGNLFKTYCSAANVVCVSATGPTNASVIGPWQNVDAFAPYSNYGRSGVGVAAPGGNASLVWAACSRTSALIPVCSTGNFILGLGGTSMAAPHVSGLAGLLVGVIGRNPALIRAALEQSADDLGQPGTDPYYGKGRINVAKALGL
jgi:subtilisin family serine protease